MIPSVGDVHHAYGGPQDQATRIWLANVVDSIGGVNGEVRYGYDTRGRLRADTAYTGSTPRVTTYAYDTYERPSSTVNPLGTWTVKYETVRGLADTLMTPMADTVIAVIDAKGQLTSRTIRSNGAKASFAAAYKMNLGLLADTTRMLGGTPYIAGSFNRVAGDTSQLALSPFWREQHGPAGALDSLSDNTTYNAWNQLRIWTGLKNGYLQSDAGYLFDATGNVGVGGEVFTFNGVTDRLLSRSAGGITHTFQYDRAGNVVQDTVSGTGMRYGYDALDRLVSARRNGVLIARYGYDVQGRRIVKRVYSAASGGTVGYLRMVYAGGQVAFETDSAGSIGLRYTWGPGADNLLAIQDESGNHFYATTDRLGSVRTLAKRDGTWLLTRRWAPYGSEISRDSSASFAWGARLRYGWTGREYDAETGLYFHRARYYSPAVGRFIQEDPIASSTSAYTYVNGSPLEATDPSGMMMSYEMRMTDYRMDELLAGKGPTGMIDGVSYSGNGSWLNMIVSGGGASIASLLGAVDISWGRQLAYITYKAAIGDARAAALSHPDDQVGTVNGVKVTNADMWTRGTPMSQSAFRELGLMNAPGSRSAESGLAVWIDARMEGGFVAMNSSFVERFKARGQIPFGWTSEITGVTMLHDKATGDIIFAVTHETFHTSSGNRNMSEGEINCAVRDAIGRRDHFGNFSVPYAGCR